MFWRLSRKQFDAEKGAGNKRALRKIVNAGNQPGIIAYIGRQPIGWCAVAPRSQYVALERSRILKAVDDQEVWSISCLFVEKKHRRQGLSSNLLRAAADFAAKQGARIIEGYPTEPTNQKTPDPFLWHGVASAFLAAGFTEVARRSQTRPIMRLIVEK